MKVLLGSPRWNIFLHENTKTLIQVVPALQGHQVEDEIGRKPAEQEQGQSVKKVEGK